MHGSRRAKHCSSTADRAESVRRWCRWPRSSAQRVVTTAGSEEGLALCRRLGAELAIDYKREDVAQRVREFAPQGVNVWWETVREPNFDLAVSLLAERGRMVLMAGRDARPQFPVGPFYVKECSLHGFVMFKATPDEQRTAADDINRWLSSGDWFPISARGSRWPRPPPRHRLQESCTIHKAGTLRGKIVLTPVNGLHCGFRRLWPRWGRRPR